MRTSRTTRISAVWRQIFPRQADHVGTPATATTTTTTPALAADSEPLRFDFETSAWMRASRLRSTTGSTTGSTTAPADADRNSSATTVLLQPYALATTKLSLARGYLELGIKDGARELLLEIMRDGTINERREAESVLRLTFDS